MHLRYKNIPNLILNKALMSELANHCAYCHSATAARSIRRHCADAHPQLLQYEPLHRAQVFGLAQLGSGKGQCMLCEQTCNNVQRHQCGVLFQLSVLLGQTYDVSHLQACLDMKSASRGDQWELCSASYMTCTTFRRWTKSDSFPPLQDQNKKQDHRFSTSSLFSLSLSLCLFTAVTNSAHHASCPAG